MREHLTLHSPSKKSRYFRIPSVSRLRLTAQLTSVVPSCLNPRCTLSQTLLVAEIRMGKGDIVNSGCGADPWKVAEWQ